MSVRTRSRESSPTSSSANSCCLYSFSSFSSGHMTCLQGRVNVDGMLWRCIEYDTTFPRRLLSAGACVRENTQGDTWRGHFIYSRQSDMTFCVSFLSVSKYFLCSYLETLFQLGGVRFIPKLRRKKKTEEISHMLRSFWQHETLNELHLQPI